VRTRPNSYSQLPKRTKVSQRLLHRRLGHKPISSLLLAQRDNFWDDIELISEEDDFCETCKITTAQKAKRGSKPLEELEPIVPGTFVMVDIINNPSSRSITRSTHLPYSLAVTDVASRIFEPIGIKDKRAATVFNAIQEWATCYGPSATFNISQLTRIHGDYDTVFRSEQLVRLAQQTNIKITSAAPRHQEQNGISEAAWKKVRKLAFSYMTEAQMDLSFFHCALEQAWKAYSALPHQALTQADGKTMSFERVHWRPSISVQLPCDVLPSRFYIRQHCCKC
jgi:hypothetical protein